MNLQRDSKGRWNMLADRTPSAITALAAAILALTPACRTAPESEAPQAPVVEIPAAPDAGTSAVARYEFGGSREALSALEERIRSASPEESLEIELQLLAVLCWPESTLAGRQFACRMLRRIGGERSIPTLTELLDDEEMAHPARFALQGLDSPAVDEALRAALEELDGDLLLGVIDTLAARGDRQALPRLEELVADERAPTARAAISAVGRIGGTEAERILSAATVAEELRSELLAARLAGAERMLAEGREEAALDVWFELSRPPHPLPSRVAAWRGIVRAQPRAAVSTVCDLFMDPDPELQRAAASLLRDLPEDADTRKLAIGLPALSESAQVLALAGMAFRGDDSAAPAAATLATESGDAEVRAAGLRALGALGDPSHVALLARCAAKGGAEGAAASSSLTRLRGREADAAILRCLERSDSQVRAAVIPCVVARRSPGAVERLTGWATDEDSATRREALRGLGRLAGEGDLPELVDLLESVEESPEAAVLEEAILGICRGAADPSGPLGLLVGALEGRPAPARASLLRVLGDLPSETSLAPLIEAAGDPDPAVRSVAVRALAEWPDAGPAGVLRDLSRTSPEAPERLLALRGWLRALALNEDLDPDEMGIAFAEALRLARTPEEREVVVERAGQAEDPWVLDFLEPLLEDDALAPAAAPALDRVRSVLARGASHDAQGRAVTLAFPYVDRYSGGDPDALTDGLWGSTNHTDGRWQGFQGTDLDAAIDLGQTIEVSSVRAGFLSNPNSWVFPPTRVEISLSADGQSWRTVYSLDPGPLEEMEEARSWDAFTELTGESARYLRVRAESVGILPEWHSGSGEKAWLFADEIQVNPRYEK